MVTDPSNDPQNKKCEGLTDNQVNIFQSWKRPLQQALTLEAENGFQNYQGKRQLFDTYIKSQLGLAPKFLEIHQLSKLEEFSNYFINYESLLETKRRRLVIDLRQFIQSLSAEYDYNPPIRPPRLNVNSYSPSEIKQSLSLLSPLNEIPGIGIKIEARLASIGLLHVKDIFLHYPRDYIDYSCLRRINDLQTGETATVVGTIRQCNSFVSPRNPNLSILYLQLQDCTGRIKATRFFAGRRFSNKSYLKSQERLYPIGSTVAVSGLVKSGSYGKTINDPVIEVLESAYSELKSKTIGRLIPIYSLTEGVTTERFRGFIDIILPLAKLWPDPLPTKILQALALPDKATALKCIHVPPNNDKLQLSRRRLVFEEFFLFQLRLLYKRNQNKKIASPVFDIPSNRISLSGKYTEALNFKLTNAQKRVLTEIESDLHRDEPMCRLLQGDVGSGKTVVAVVTLLNAVDANYQAALMAPTEVLAEQHYRNLCKYLPQLHVTVELLTGSTPLSRRREILMNLRNGSLDILVGTHALIEDPVSFSNLGLVVVDEQHRFGVRQRNLLIDKGVQPNLLTMTATPIPRTLALSLHGDLDVSQLDELPPGRTPVFTRLFSRSEVHQVYQLIRDEVSRGHQAYIVLPLIDESEKLDLRSAIQSHEELSKSIFPDYKVGLLHGRMTGIAKQKVIQEFVGKKYNILVSTTVVEVGVDIPNATVMVIENAERFGLSQLHQLRGRVGRGSLNSHCILIHDGSHQNSKQRLEFLVASNDGFEISEIDLKLRGPGQFLGTKQSGLPDFALASLIDDADVLELARKHAVNLLKGDPELKTYTQLKTLIDNPVDVFHSTPQLN